jgi:hypothetical protein
VRRVVTVVALAVAFLAACGSRDVQNRFVPGPTPDGGADAAADAGGARPADAQPDVPAAELGSPCVDDGQCDDMIACTYDSCDKALGRCVHVPDDTQCDDGIYCDGREECVVGHGCEPGPVVTCSTGTACSIASCVEATKSCAYAPRDVDGDGDPDVHCSGGHDCNDLDPNVSSLHAEVCNNGIDDNCNGVVDEAPCVSPAGDTCMTAILAPGAGTYALSTVGDTLTFATTCSVTHAMAAQTTVAAITVPPGPNVNLQVWATTPGIEVAVAIDGTCGQASTELACGSGANASSVRAVAYGVSPGTYYAVVVTQSETPVELEVDLLPATGSPKNVDCATATTIQASTPTTVSIVEPPTLLPTTCAAVTGELTYAISLAQPQDILVYASTVKGSGTPIVGLRDPTCTGATDEIACAASSALPLFARAKAAGVYVVTVSATSPIDASLDVVLSPPTASPPDQTCVSPPPLAANGTVAFDLSSHEDAIHDGCAATGHDAAYQLSVPAASDVLLIERIPETEVGAVSLDPPACASNLACATGPTPVHIGKRNVLAGTYFAVVNDSLGLQGSLDALVRPTVAPTILAAGAADTCAAPFDVSLGGFFTGDTSTANADYDNPCDTPTSPPGGAKDQVLSLNLTQPQRVVLDTEGSSYTTILDVRQSGAPCPGLPLTNGCYVGFGAQRSFLDLELAAGQYWILMDGFGGGSGPWNLDVRLLPP